MERLDKCWYILANLICHIYVYHVIAVRLIFLFSLISCLYQNIVNIISSQFYYCCIKPNKCCHFNFSLLSRPIISICVPVTRMGISTGGLDVNFTIGTKHANISDRDHINEKMFTAEMETVIISIKICRKWQWNSMGFFCHKIHSIKKMQFLLFLFKIVENAKSCKQKKGMRGWQLNWDTCQAPGRPCKARAFNELRR